MTPARAGAVISFVLTSQFLLTLLWILMAWPPEGLSGLDHAMAHFFRARIGDPIPFALCNLYNVSFAISALALAVVMRWQFSDFPRRMEFVFATIGVAAAMYIASGVVPLVAAPGLLKSGDESALNAIEGISAGLLLAGTMANGIAVSTFAFIGFRSKRVPFGLCILLLATGTVQLFEWAVPAFLVIDPFLGTFWSVWLGTLLWNDRIASSAPPSQQPIPEQGLIK